MMHTHMLDMDETQLDEYLLPPEEEMDFFSDDEEVMTAIIGHSQHTLYYV